MGYGLEVELVRAAHQQDLLTTPYVFEPAQAAAMAEAGADMLVPHMGLTTGGDIGASTALKLEDCPALIDAMAAAARAVRPDILVLCHGGPIATPDDATWILQHTQHCHGFYGASSMERLPTEQALTATDARVQVDHLLKPGKRQMPKAYASTVVNAPAATVWAAIRDFNGLPGWVAAIADSMIEDGKASDQVGLRAQHASAGRRPYPRAPAQLQRRRPALFLQFRDDAVRRAQLPRHAARHPGHRRRPQPSSSGGPPSTARPSATTSGSRPSPAPCSRAAWTR